MKTETPSNGISKLFASSQKARVGLVLLAGLFIGVPCVNAAAMVSKSDEGFMMAAAQGGMTEVKLGELAVQNGTRQDVKDFGAMMVKDHSAINDSMKALATLKDVMLPANLDAKHQKMVDKQAALTGSKFDDAYIATMVKAHKMDLKAFQGEASKTKDPDVKNFVNQAIPIIEQHLKMIEAMKK
jgi:putative membrane protein